MKVVISAGGRFHAHRLSQELTKHNALLKLFTFDYTKKDVINLPPKYVIVITSCKIANDLFVRLRLSRFVNPARFNDVKDNLFDWLVSKHIEKMEPFDLFVGWAHYAQKSLPAVRKKGAKIILESGSCHIQEQENILREVYGRFNLSFFPIKNSCKQKMLDEYAQADYIMTLSDFAHQSFIQHKIPPKKLLTSPCGIDVAFFLAPRKKPKELFQVIFVGLVTIRKGIHTLLEAWKLAKLPTNKARLVIVGSMQKDFAHIAHTLPLSPSIVFAGPKDRMTLKKLYHESSLFVLPSLEDGFGMVIGEAMASGLPVVCSTHSAGPELTGNGKYGFLFQPEDTQKLADILDWCFHHRHEIEEMGHQGQNFIKQFSWDAYGDRIHAIYQNIVANKY